MPHPQSPALPRFLLPALLFIANVTAGLAAPIEPIYPIEPAAGPPALAPKAFDLVLLAGAPVTRALEQGRLDRVKDPVDGKPCFLVDSQQAGLRIDEPAFVTPATTLAWSWKKEKGTVAIVQVGLKNPETGQTRYLGYAAGAWSEPPSPDPTVEVFLSTQPPRTWTAHERRLQEDVRRVLGWSSAQITSFYFSPWDGQPGMFRDAAIRQLAPADQVAVAREAGLRRASRAGRGHYVPQRLMRPDETRVAKFEASFEECAPGRNSGANEWSAFGAIGNVDFNCLGRELWVRYPAFDLVFRLYEGDQEIRPGRLESFRLGLVDNRLPAIWAGWQHGGLLYRV